MLISPSNGTSCSTCSPLRYRNRQCCLSGTPPLCEERSAALEGNRQHSYDDDNRLRLNIKYELAEGIHATAFIDLGKPMPAATHSAQLLVFVADGIKEFAAREKGAVSKLVDLARYGADGCFQRCKSSADDCSTNLTQLVNWCCLYRCGRQNRLR